MTTEKCAIITLEKMAWIVRCDVKQIIETGKEVAIFSEIGTSESR